MEFTKNAQIFDEAVEVAKASGRLFRTESHFTLGNRVVYFTDQEATTAQERTLAVAPGEAVAVVNVEFERAAARLLSDFPPSERLSWPIQEAEALAWNANNNAATPYIDVCASARGITRTLYLQKTLVKVQAFRAASARMIGTRQKALDAVAVAQDLAGITAARDAAIAALRAMP